MPTWLEESAPDATMTLERAGERKKFIQMPPTRIIGRLSGKAASLEASIGEKLKVAVRDPAGFNQGTFMKTLTPAERRFIRGRARRRKQRARR